MELEGITWIGPPLEDDEFVALLPADLGALLQQLNGFILRGGALHVRGAVAEPSWHSLRRYWTGDTALHVLYEGVSVDDLPFAQDCVGDQFLLRSNEVWRVSAEYGGLEPLGLKLFPFLEAAARDPLEFLCAQPLANYTSDGARLQPGELLFAYPPFCVSEANEGVSLAAIPADEVIAVHAKLAEEIRDLPDGASIVIKPTQAD